MYERFTESARKTMALALREAQRSGQENVDTEHILLGLIDQPDCSAVKILSSFQLDLNSAPRHREECDVHSRFGHGPGTPRVPCQGRPRTGY